MLTAKPGTVSLVTTC